MKLSFTIKGLLLATVLILISCDSTPSLQKYIVDSKENNEFMSIDIPASIIQLKNVDVSEEVKNTLGTIKKMNFLALQLNNDNHKLYDSEKLKVKKILKNPKYKQLVRFKRNKSNVSVSYLGKEDAINEVVLFGSDNEKGFAIVRILGEKMNPSDIIKLSQDIKIDGNSNQIKQLESLFKSLN
ncbi:MAG: DUF4252 domain-containing protein [Lutibacter sp.]|uniref:DUF4252 domain-containing protein n=1 Tax=Lutibacter sp. TaxID=1925666 RepID=UPI00299E4C21|nr:DUF4252 domain-containing protein [Lutibacter sp.]MDX1828072.1 DUF4252 domain-containing protein [Lutibacter sp.]